MKKIFFYIVILFLFLVFGFLMLEIGKYKQENDDFVYWQPSQKPVRLILDVPYINEAPDGNFSGNWKNACEEASIAMVEKYYLGIKSVSIIEAMSYMQNLFLIEDRIYNTNASIDAAQTVNLINNYTSFKATIKENPLIKDIKKQIQKNRPVISLHYGFDLQNPDIPFSRTGSYYHMLVIVGYDDETQEFIVHDDGDQKFGANHRYDYELFMNSLHDYIPALNKTIGPPCVIFTRP